ncbi:MAG: hypothetical protein Q9191_001328 [Dirinaria sp. TL-2023a]
MHLTFYVVGVYLLFLPSFTAAKKIGSGIAAATNSVISTVGFLGALSGIISFEEQHTLPDESKSNLRVQVALNLKDGLGADGDGPDVRLWDETGDFIGIKVDPGYIDAGSYKDIEIDQHDTRQPTYALLTANDNAICIAYHSGVVEHGRSLDCTWMDKDSDSLKTKGIGIHFPSFKPKGNNVTETGADVNDKD